MMNLMMNLCEYSIQLIYQYQASSCITNLFAIPGHTLYKIYFFHFLQIYFKFLDFLSPLQYYLSLDFNTY